MKRFLKIVAIILLIFFFSIIIVIYSGSNLPANADEMIARQFKAELPELFKGETGYATNNGIRIWYEIQRPAQPVKNTIVLSMGAAGTATFWPDYLIRPLLDAGYQVIRYDYRGTGLSDWLENWTEASAYSIHDMTADIKVILDQENINRAHMVGMSMGGVIARAFALDYPDRTASLSMIVSTGVFNNVKVKAINQTPGLAMFRLLLRYGIWSNEEDQMKFILGVMHLMNADSPEALDNDLILQQTLYELRKRRGFHAAALQQHFYAIKKYELSDSGPGPLKRNILYILGERDPLMSPSVAKQQLKDQPGARLLVLSDVAHIVPQSRVQEVIQALHAHMQAESQF